MKRTLALGFLVLSMNVFASGKIQFKPGYYLKSKQLGGQVGLAVYEPLIGKLAYNQWTGYGYAPRLHEKGVNYFVSTHDLEIPTGNLTVGAGFTFKHTNQESEKLFSDSDIHLKISYKLW